MGHAFGRDFRKGPTVMKSTTFDSPGARKSSEGMPSPNHLMLVWEALRRWWMYVIPAGLFLGILSAAFAYATFVPVFRARALLWIDTRDAYLVSPNRDRSFVNNQLGLMRSNLVLGPAVSREDISRLAEIAEAPEPIEKLRHRVNINRAWSPEHFHLTATSSDPRAAATIVNAVASEYLSLVGSYESGREQRLIDLLELEREASEREVELLRDQVRQMTIDQTGRDPFAGQQMGESSFQYPLNSLHGQLTSLSVEQSVLRAQIESLEEFLETHTSSVSPDLVERVVSDDPRVRQRKEEIERKRDLLRSMRLSAVEGDQSPRYQVLEEEIRLEEELLDQLREELRGPIEGDLAEGQVRRQRQRLADLKGRYREQEIRRGALTAAFEEKLGDIKQYTGENLSLELKRAELRRAQGVLDQIAQRSFMLRTEQRAPQRVEVMEEATVPVRPVETLPVKRLGLFFAAGFGFPLLLAVGWDFRCRHVMTSNQLRAQTQLPVIGEVARLPLQAGGSRYFGHRRSRRSYRLFEESVESVRTCLLLTNAFQEAQILAIASAATREGKTTLATQLAISLARTADRPTLLIDGDLRAPNLHEIFDVSNEKGLVQVLREELRWQDAVVVNGHPRLHLLPAGKLKGSPHKLFGTPLLGAIFAELRDTYQYVVVDTPPVLAAGESLVVAKAADATLICTRRDVSRQEQVGGAYSRLSLAGANVIGCVFNEVPLSHYRYRYGGYYGEDEG